MLDRSRIPLGEAAILLGFRWIRRLERALPARLICGLIWPWAALRAAWQLTLTGPTIRQFDRLPAALRPTMSRPAWVTYLWRERVRVNHARMLCLWRDRLAEGPWSAHCRSDGLERLEREHARGRPVALACLHFGPLNVVCHCLRGRGLPLAFLRFLPSDRLPLYWRYVDRLGDRDVRALGPIAFDGSELRPALEHLRSGRILAMVVERGHGERVRLSGAGFRFDMGTGVLRMAARTGAVVMPCLITAGAGMSVAIHLGEPVPEELVSDPGRHHLACEHLFRELFAVVARYPGQAHSELIEHLRPAAVGAAVAAEVVPELIS